MSKNSRRTFCVSITSLTTHEYEVDARSPEEAVSIAEDWLDDGEEGVILESETIDSDATEIPSGLNGPDGYYSDEEC